MRKVNVFGGKMSNLNTKGAEKTRRLVMIAILSALIIVLQIISNFIKFGPVQITLALTPVIIGAAMYGIGAKKKYMHSVFHLFCLAGTFFHFWAVYGYLL